MQYLILRDPGHNRVYYKESVKMCEEELKLCFIGKKVEVSSIEIEIKLSRVSTSNKLTGKELKDISRLSFGCYIRSEDDRWEKLSLQYQGLRGISLKRFQIYYVTWKDKRDLYKDDDKRFSVFSDFSFDDEITLLDPIAGRGTTLFEAAGRL